MHAAFIERMLAGAGVFLLPCAGTHELGLSFFHRPFFGNKNGLKAEGKAATPQKAVFLPRDHYKLNPCWFGPFKAGHLPLIPPLKVLIRTLTVLTGVAERNRTLTVR